MKLTYYVLTVAQAAVNPGFCHNVSNDGVAKDKDI